MSELLKFECPRCHRPYELTLDLVEVKRKRQRAKCARCGERFEIASRVEAMRIGGAPRTEPPSNQDQDAAASPVSTRLAAALQNNASNKPQPELIPSVDFRESTDETLDFERQGPPTIADGSAALERELRSRAEPFAQGSEIDAADIIEEEEIDEAELPEPLDWLASAGAGPEILHRELSERERELAALLTH